MILKAKHHFFLYPYFKKYAVWKVKKNFKEVKINADVYDKGLPVLAISNHVSWWDGFWVEFVNLKIFKKKFFFMMLEKQLRKYWFFNYIGGYSVTTNSKSILESLAYTRYLLGDNKNFVLLFPQGKIHSLYDQSVVFQRGIEKITEGLEDKIQIFFVVNLIDYFSNPKPTLFVFMENFESDSFSFDNIQNGYTDFFNRCVVFQKQHGSEL